LREADVKSVSRCPFCRAFVQGGDRFCWSCGSDLHSRPRQRQAHPTHEPDSAVEFLVRRAHLARRRGQMAEAERLIREALARESNNVPALTMLSEMLRVKGDFVGAVELAQRATEVAAPGGAPPGSVRRAREQRAGIQRRVVRDVVGSQELGADLVGLFAASGVVWYQSGRFYGALAALGLACLFLALVATLRGQLVGYLWFAISLTAAGWCYWDAEMRTQAGLFWGPFVLCLGPFGLGIYLLAR
jgi:hypothetical protein